MAKVLVTDTNLTNIANSIRSKNGSSNTYTPSQMSTAINNFNASNFINGIIEEYYIITRTGFTISAGNFVKFVNQERSSNSYIGSSTQYCGNVIKAIQLTDTKVFIAHSYQSSSSSKPSLRAIICNVNNKTGAITAGSDTILDSSDYSGSYITVSKLSSDKVVVFHSKSSGYNLYGIVCTISNNAISKGTDTALNKSSMSGVYMTSHGLSDNRAIVIHKYDSSGKMYGLTCSISGTTISKVNDTSISSYNTAIQPTSVLLDDDKILLCFYSTGQTTNKMYMYLITISDFVVNNKNNTSFTPTNNPVSCNNLSSILVSDNKVLLTYGTTLNNDYLYGVIITVSGISMSKEGTETQLSSTTYSGRSTSLIKDDLTNNILIYHSNTSSYNLYKMECSINKNNITINEDKNIGSSYSSGHSISAVNILIVNNYTGYYYLAGYSRYKVVDEITNLESDNIAGIINKSGVSGNLREIIIPDTN